MPKYLLLVSYTATGESLAKDGGSKRRRPQHTGAKSRRQAGVALLAW
jgi:hypothetical protein